MISGWIKLPYTLFVCVLVPVYWVERGPANFLWISDIALLVSVPALWMENRFLTSMMAVGVLLPELACMPCGEPWSKNIRIDIYPERRRIIENRLKVRVVSLVES